MTARATFGGLLRAEWIKLFTLRATWWLYGITILLFVGIALLATASAGDWAHSSLNPDVTQTMYGPGHSEDSQLRAGIGRQMLAWLVPALTFGQLLISVLGVLSISGEYQTGMIRSTFAADPRRLGSLGAKALVAFLAAALVGLIAIALALAAVTLLLLATGWPLQLDDGYLWRTAGSAVGYLGFAGVFGVLVGAIVRVQAGAITTVIGFILILPPVISLLAALTDWAWIYNVGQFLPYSLGNELATYPAAEVAAIGIDPSQIPGYQPPPGPWVTPELGGIDSASGRYDPELDTGRVAVGAAAAAVSLLGWLVAGWIAAALATRRRDV